MDARDYSYEEYASTSASTTPILSASLRGMAKETTPPRRADFGRRRLVFSEGAGGKGTLRRSMTLTAAASSDEPCMHEVTADMFELDFSLDCSEELYDAICEKERVTTLTLREKMLKIVFERERVIKLRERVLLQRIADLESALANATKISSNAPQTRSSIPDDQENVLPGSTGGSKAASKTRADQYQVYSLLPLREHN